MRLTTGRVIRLQGSYYLITGLWPLIHMASFEAVTGPKVDDWLVRMVGLLVVVIGTTLLVAVTRGREDGVVLVLAVGSALAFTAVDAWYSLSGVISPVYLADSVVELVLVGMIMGARR